MTDQSLKQTAMLKDFVDKIKSRILVGDERTYITWLEILDLENIVHSSAPTVIKEEEK